MDAPTAKQFTLSGRLKPGFIGGLHHQAGWHFRKGQAMSALGQKLTCLCQRAGLRFAQEQNSSERRASSARLANGKLFEALLELV